MNAPLPKSPLTDGPWRAQFNGTIIATIDPSRPLLDVVVGMAIAPSDMGARGFEIQRVNAHMMAAAPALLAELERLLPGAEAMGWDTTKARAAIKAARPEPL